MSGRDGAAPVTALARSLALDLTGRDQPLSGVVGVGVDAVDLARFAGVIGRRVSVVRRLFTPAELAYAHSARDPVPRLSTRFAAKEAAMKALGVGLGAFPFHDVEVTRTGLDAPALLVTGAAAVLAGRRGVVRWHLALSHTDQVAVALVVAEGPGVEAAGARPRVVPGAEGRGRTVGSSERPATA